MFVRGPFQPIISQSRLAVPGCFVRVVIEHLGEQLISLTLRTPFNVPFAERIPLSPARNSTAS